MSSLLPSILRSYIHQHNMVRFLEQSEWWTKDQLHKYQFERLKDLLNHAKNNVSYYSNLFQKKEIDLKDIQSLKDLKNIPFLTREIVRKNKEELKAKNFPISRFEESSTSGTTGKPLKFYIEKDKWLANHIAINRMYMKRGGFSRRYKSISLFGSKTIKKYRPIFRTLELSSLYLDQYYKEYIKEIKKVKPRSIIAYPSALYFLSNYLKKENKRINTIHSIFCHGEVLFDWQRRTINDVFCCNIFDIYGHGEKSVFAATCEKSKQYHVFQEYSIVELINENGELITNEDDIGEIVVTGLYSHIFPFIRYRTGDLGIYTSKKCKCGRNHQRIKKIVGRINDYLLTKNSELVSPDKINIIIDQYAKTIKKWQIIQESKGEIIINFIPFDNRTKYCKKSLIDHLNTCCKKDFDFYIHSVNELVDDGSRKHHFLIQKLSVNKLQS